MTLKILENTPFDLGPEFWAVIILISLIVIEVCQLGPHLFKYSPKKEAKGSNTTSATKLKRRGRHAPTDKTTFGDVVGGHYFGERDHALLYVGSGGEDMKFRPEPVDTSEVNVYPPTNMLDNYIMAFGEDPELIVLDQLLTLWAAKDRSDAKYAVLYCSQLPSSYGVQRIADVLQGYTDKVGVSVLYARGMEGDEDDASVDVVQEKREHLKKASITLTSITVTV